MKLGERTSQYHTEQNCLSIFKQNRGDKNAEETNILKTEEQNYSLNETIFVHCILLFVSTNRAPFLL